MKKVIVAVLVAAGLWFYMFSPLTAGLTNFWVSMTFSALVLTGLALGLSKGDRSGLRGLRGLSDMRGSSDRSGLRDLRGREALLQTLLGVAIAFALWGVFWLGDKISSALFGFARPQVDAVYSIKEGFPTWAIALLLLFIIGPAEEFFWRGFVQKKITEAMGSWRYPADSAFIITTLVYGLVHVPSMNFMLVMAALVAGSVWGFIYRLNPKLLPSLIISHALWDALVFVILPI